MRLLVVEDDPQIADGLLHGLRRAGHAVDVLGDGREADTILVRHDYDLVILDLGLPGLDGYAVLRRLRERDQNVPVLILTARDDLTDRVRGLNLGADDYLVKPFELAELDARINAITRRALAGSGGDIRVGELRFSPASHRVEIGATPVELSPREYGVLELLLLRRDHVVSKSAIQEHLCDWDEELTDGAIEIYIHRLRRKLENSNVEIRTIRGFGYLLQAHTTA